MMLIHRGVLSFPQLTLYPRGKRGRLARSETIKASYHKDSQVKDRPLP